MVRDHSLVVVYTYAYVAVEKYYKTYQNFYGNQRLFRQINVFTKEVTKELISRKIFERRSRILQYFSTPWLKNLTSKWFDEKKNYMAWQRILRFPMHLWSVEKIQVLRYLNSSVISKFCKLLWWKFCQNSVREREFP